MTEASVAAAPPFAWPHTHTLSHPAEALGESIASLTLREPNATDLLEAGIFDGNIGGEQMLDLIAKLAGKPPALVRALPGLDMLALSATLSTVFRKAAS